MGFAQIIKKNNFLYETYLSFRVLLKHGNLSPEKVELLGTGHSIYLKPKDRRAKALLLLKKPGQQWVKTFWNKAASSLEPDLILDCGINYGEILFYPTYSPKSKVIGFEADPSFIPILEKSKHEHPNSSQISILNTLLADEEKKSASFYVKKKWSGGSSAIPDKNLKDSEVEKIDVPMNSIDNLIRGIEYKKDTLLFKIDVEGYEPLVIRGMSQLMSSFENVLGTIEYNPDFLQRLGISSQEFLDELTPHFGLYIWKNDNNIEEVKSTDADTIDVAVYNSYAKHDLILASSPELLFKSGYSIA